MRPGHAGCTSGKSERNTASRPILSSRSRISSATKIRKSGSRPGSTFLALASVGAAGDATVGFSRLGYLTRDDLFDGRPVAELQELLRARSPRRAFEVDVAEEILGPERRD